MSMYAGDEDNDDNITSGPVDELGYGYIDEDGVFHFNYDEDEIG